MYAHKLTVEICWEYFYLCLTNQNTLYTKGDRILPRRRYLYATAEAQRTRWLRDSRQCRLLAAATGREGQTDTVRHRRKDENRPPRTSKLGTRLVILRKIVARCLKQLFLYENPSDIDR